MASHCSDRLYRIKPWIQTFWSYCSGTPCDWLDLNTFPPAEYALPRTRRLLNTWKPVLTLRQVSVRLIYAEPNHGERLSGATAVARGGVWLDLNTFPPAKNALLRTRRLINTRKTGFAIATCQCSGHLCWIKPWIETFWCYCSGRWCWLTNLNTFP